jgi:hypothetical protein
MTMPAQNVEAAAGAGVLARDVLQGIQARASRQEGQHSAEPMGAGG